MSWHLSVTDVVCVPSPCLPPFQRPFMAPVCASVKMRGLETIFASSGCANGTLMISMRNSAVLGLSSGCPPEHPASSSDWRTFPVRQSEELAGCSGGQPEDNPNTALFRIDIIKVPLAHPELAKIVSSPRIFTDAQTGAMNGLWKGGKHGEGTQTTSVTDKCHDITIYSALGLAAGACSGNGILLDISNPVNPVRIAAVNDPNYAFWHSANFNNAGTKVLFTDEWGGGGQPRCRATDPMNWGADAIFELSKGKLTLASYYKMPAPQTETENCVAHNGSLLPIPGRDVFVQAWYQGGVSVVDFTDTAHPIEIAYFDRGPVDPAKRAMGGQWSTYWYNGYI